MMTFQRQAMVVSCMAVFMLASSAHVFSETKTADDAQALLQEVKKKELDRQIATKQTEVNRLNEDLTKGRKESEDLKRSIDGIAVTITETNSHLDELAAEKTRLTQALEVTNLRIDAGKLKVNGLKMLSDAQGKALNTLAIRIEDTDLRTTLGAAELKLLSNGPIPEGADPEAVENTAKLKTQISELKKKRAKTDRTTSEAGTAAREAMEAAASKLQVADVAAGKARKRAEELGLAEMTKSSTDKATITGPKAIPIR